MKSILQSVTFHGAWTTMLFTVLHIAGLHLDKDQTLGILSEAQAIWPQLGILGGCFLTLWHRLTHADFSVSRLQTPHFVFSLVTAILSFAQAFGVNTEDFGHLAADSQNIATRLLGLGASVIMTIGVIRSGKPIEIRKALPA